MIEINVLNFDGKDCFVQRTVGIVIELYVDGLMLYLVLYQVTGTLGRVL